MLAYFFFSILAKNIGEEGEAVQPREMKYLSVTGLGLPRPAYNFPQNAKGTSLREVWHIFGTIESNLDKISFYKKMTRK